MRRLRFAFKQIAPDSWPSFKGIHKMKTFSRFSVDCLRISCFLIASMAICAGAQQEPKRAGRSAAERMRRAHDARAQWDEFSGFTADLVVFAGTERARGKLVVNAAGEVDVQMRGDGSFSWVSEDLQSLVDHRLPGDQQEYDVSFEDDPATALGRLIRFNDDRMHSVYRIRQDVITEVHRTMGQRVLLISVIDTKRNHSKKHLPQTYSVNWTDAETGKLLSSEVVHNDWVRVQELDLPSRVLKVIHSEDGSREVRNLRLSNHQVTAAAE